MTTIRKSTRKQQEKLNQAVNEWLELASEIQKMKRKQDNLFKEVIEPFAMAHKSEFTDNKYELETGYLIWAKGRPRLVTSEGKSLNKEIKRLLIKRLPVEVIKQDVDMTQLEEVISENPLVKKALVEYELELVRNPSLQVKPYKAKK